MAKRKKRAAPRIIDVEVGNTLHIDQAIAKDKLILVSDGIEGINQLINEMKIQQHNMLGIGVPAKESNPATMASTFPEPLTDREHRVIQILIDLPPARGLKGREILTKLSRAGVFVDHSTLTKSIIPRLKQHYGVRNRKGVGYYVDPAHLDEVRRKLAANSP